MELIIMQKLDHIYAEHCKHLVHTISDYVKQHRKLTYCSAGVLTITLLASKFRFRKRFFAWLFYKASATRYKEYDEVKKKFLEPLSKQISHDPKLREDNSISILEIGVGTGMNFEFFPEGCHLIAVDPNPYFAKYYDENRLKFPNIKTAEIIVSTGEEMDIVPSNSVDAVVTTLVMCSVSDLAKFVCQIKRVLAPGGKFYFMEHVGEWNRKEHLLRWRLQQFWTYCGVWPFIFDGCHLNRDPLPTIRAVGGFADIQKEYFYAPLPDEVSTLLQPHLKGVVTK